MLFKNTQTMTLLNLTAALTSSQSSQFISSGKYISFSNVCFYSGIREADLGASEVGAGMVNVKSVAWER